MAVPPFLIPRFLRHALALAAFAALSHVTVAPALAEQHRSAPRILVIGDSLMAFHSASGRGVAAHLSRALGAPVKDRSVSGARMIYRLPISGALGLSIPKQYRDGDWDWVIANGGGNDLWLGCGCKTDCTYKIDQLISRDGTHGAIPRLLAKIRKSGARVLWLGYLRSPGFDTPIEDCKDEGDELEARIASLAARDPSLLFHSITDLVPEGDTSYHAIDRIHPSYKGSAAIAGRIAEVIRNTR